MRPLLLAGSLLLLASHLAAQAIDSDQDGLSDATENVLLQQFTPHFMVGHDDCSTRPAQFTPFQSKPIVQQDDGTIYGQAFPSKGHPNQVELHYYHLWRRDCGEMGHNLDAEHVSVLITQDLQTDSWKALYWYAAAHENTVCDASQITRASTLHAETEGPTIWISLGKHAAFLEETICTHGCGGDHCQKMEALPMSAVINLGEASAPMNGALWLTSSEWPLKDKLLRSDFTASRTNRVDHLSESNIAWANPEKRPVQAAILGGNDAIGGAATGAQATNTALIIANTNTSSALDNAASGTGNALAATYRNIKNAIRKSAKKTGEAIGIKDTKDGN
jgi:hypothetical protein